MRRDKITGVWLKKEIRGILDEIAERTGRTVSELIREAIAFWLEKTGKLPSNPTASNTNESEKEEEK